MGNILEWPNQDVMVQDIYVGDNSLPFSVQ